jgi:hypothetical protein
MHTLWCAHYMLFSIICLLQISNTFTDNTSNTEYTVVLPENDSGYEPRDYMYELQQPISFTRQGIKRYFKNVYNRSEYCTEFLPHSFCHLIEFLEYGNKTSQEAVYTQASFRLFANKVKATRYITANTLLDLLNKMPDLLERYFKQDNPSFVIALKKQITNLFYDSFLHKFTTFKQSPESFLGDLSDEVLALVERSDLIRNEVDREQLRQTLVRFLELSLDKVIWSPFDQEEVWESVKAISNQLAVLKDRGILSYDDLNDVCKSLLERFCHFLDLAGSDLSLEAVNKIKEDIASGKVDMLELEEQEDFIETKADRISRSIRLTEAKIRARGFGILSEVRVQ